ncbi:MAG: 16S rRNA (cytidine(1402)-2'-O)-methyltransferase [Elusimicrobia bacterium]|nr:16S rRNA (cytidine(1402)-2'-O)-methyltransferase [Elusimicrobiota bacterium]MBI5882150.1 16S rRNA (cytidine(1402)-2'-O)-methyltransferase [Elusimicrobiota bacterium]
MLYLVPTPIGNLEDISPRALRALGSVRAVFCEDTRRTRKLFSHFKISTPLLRYNERDERSRRTVLDRLRDGEDIAVVSDGGMPGLSDPGRRIVALAREAGVGVSALPGPNAAVTALAGSGMPADSFVMLGFLPRSPSKRLAALRKAAALGKTIVFYESPFRVLKALAEAETALGASCPACAAREMTKIHEEWVCGTVAEVRAALTAKKEILGEFVLVFGAKEENGNATEALEGTATETEGSDSLRESEPER